MLSQRAVRRGARPTGPALWLLGTVAATALLSHGAQAQTAPGPGTLAISPYLDASPLTTLTNAIQAPASGLAITSSSYIGADNQAGTYTGFSIASSTAGKAAISAPNGVLLTTGTAAIPLTNTSSSFGVTTDSGSNAALSALSTSAGGTETTRDQDVLTIKFTVANAAQNAVKANFVYASEEYPDQQVTDIFGFYVDGKNYAAFPDGSLVSFKGTTSGFFNDNTDGSYPIEYDGISNLLTINGLLDTSLTEHTLTIAIADTSDAIFDSGAFIGNLQGATVSGGGGIQTGTSGVINTTGGDLTPNVFSLGSAAARATTLDFAGGALRLTGGSFAGNVVGAPVTIEATGGTIDTAMATGGFSGVVAGPGSLTIIGGGTFQLTGANSYAGGTVVNASTVAVGNDTALGTGVLALNGSTLQALGAALTLGNAATLFGAATIDTQAFALTYAGTIAGPGSLTKAGTGTLVLPGANSYAGGTSLNAGTVTIGNAASLGTGALTFAGGTLQAGVEGLSLGTAATLAGSGTIDTQGFGLTYTGPIGGAGALAKSGTGTLVLPGANTYAGGTTLGAGTVSIGNAASLGTGALTFAGGTVQAGVAGLTLGYAATVATAGAIDTQGFGLLYTGAVTGPGALAKLGTGTLTVTGDFGYNGGTTIAAGTLRIGNGGTAGSLAGNVANSGLLAFDRADDLTFAGMITGSGAVSKDGAGTLTLPGANSYAGGTAVHAGTLAIGDSASLGTGTLSLDDGTTLRFTGDQITLANAVVLTGIADPTIDTGSGSQTIAGPITGAGDLTKLGSGTLDLTGVNTYTGATTVAAGTLLVDGSVANSTVTVNNGATLGGIGSIGSLVAQPGSRVAPSGGQALTVLGNVTFGSGSTYQVTVNGDGSTSRLAIGGRATLNGANLSVLAGPGAFNVSRTYTLLSAPGGVSGTFGAVQTATALALLTPSLSYTADSVLLNLRQNDFALTAATSNQAAVAKAIQALGPGNALFDAVAQQDQAGARQAFNATTGVTHASSTTTVRTTTLVLTGMVMDRMWDVGGSGLSARQVLDQFETNQMPALVRCYGPVPEIVPATAAKPASYTVWGEGFGSFGHTDANANAGSLDRTLGGFVLGVDTPLSGFAERWRAGIAGGYTNTTFASPLDGGSGTVEGVFGSLYGGARYGAVDIKLGTTVSGNSTDSVRRVVFPGFLEVERSNYGGLSVQGFGEIGYRIPVAKAVLEPVVGAAIYHVHQDAFTERGGAAALVGAAQDTDLGTTTLGFRGEVAPVSGVPLVAHAFLGWQHTIGTITPTSTLAFESAASNTFTASGSPIDRDALTASAALDYRTSAAMDVGLSYSGFVGPTTSEHAVKGRVEYRF